MENRANKNLEALTRTLLYEGYALYPYNRSAVKNQKPIPFGVVFPQGFSACDEYANCHMQSECIVRGSNDIRLTISIRFLHLKQIELFETTKAAEKEEQLNRIDHATICNKYYQAGWQTVERKISTGEFPLANLLKGQQVILFSFQKEVVPEYIKDEDGCVVLKRIQAIAGVKGRATISAVAVTGQPEAFKLSVDIMNTTPIEDAEEKTRDDLHGESFLSTHILFEATNGYFISHLDPEQQWKSLIAGCKQKNLWPVLIDENDSTLLASPIILYDHPMINAKSSGDLFDSTEIEEALLLHVSVLSDQEKERLAQTDDKLKAMLNKAADLTPEEMAGFHSHLQHSDKIAGEKNDNA